MTEQEYIDVSNLARIRVTKSGMGWLLPVAGLEKAFLEEALQALTRWEKALEKKLEGKVV